ncbi:MAG: precorrin-8X methylmutase [Lachnospiraceae bacterium]|nr:precorrin-8X methylmutase [Lachnospiraceae bacterium]
MIINAPGDIEKRSMEIIESELKTEIPEDRKAIIKRVIHCTADFDYEENLCFSNGAVQSALEAMRSGCNIFTDTQMARSGINKTAAGKLGCELHCFISDPDIAAIAKERGCTRAVASVEKMAAMDPEAIFVFGNAPTALLRLTELIQEGKARPKLVVGVPVGFVNIIESKEAIMAEDVPYIVGKGRKGGSNVAAAIVNALMYQITR